MEDDKLTLEQQLETGLKIGKGSQIKDVNLAEHKRMLEEKARKEREDMKRQLLVGLESAGGASRDDMRIMLAA